MPTTATHWTNNDTSAKVSRRASQGPVSTAAMPIANSSAINIVRNRLPCSQKSGRKVCA